MKQFIYFIAFTFLFVISCQKEEYPQSNESLFREIKFKPNVPISIEKGILIFENFDDVDKFIEYTSDFSNDEICDWENSIGFISLRNNFNKVQKSEDSINDYFENNKLFGSSQIYSKNLLNSIENNTIKWINDVDGTVYWDYSTNFIDKVSILNINNLVKINDKIYNFSNDNLIKIIKDGDFDKISQINELNSEINNQNFQIISMNSNSQNDCIRNSWDKNNNWRYPQNKRRAKIEINGDAFANLTIEGCKVGTTCSFTINTYAQKKNFWGNWVYSGSYGPSLKVTNGDWSFKYTLQTSYCVGGHEYHYNDLFSSNNRPLFNKYWSWTNRGVLPLNPSKSGWWEFNKSISCTIDMESYNIPVNFAGYNNWNLIK